jgi:prephenate dehydratase
MPRATYLGPEGTHTGEAARACPLLKDWELVPVTGIRGAFGKFVAGEADAAVLPLENSLEGAVGTTLDLLAGPEGEGVKIRREIVRPIAHALLTRRRVPDDAEGFRKYVLGIVSHPQALAQCALNIARRFPFAALEAASSTAEAARQVAGGRPGWVALAPRESAAQFNLQVREEDLSDEPGNRTRFVVLAREDERPTGNDRTSIVFGLDRDHPGGLYDALGVFATRGINLSRIESRPTRKGLGDYWFFVDFEGHREDPTAALALAALETRTGFLRMLGSYPRAT